MDQKQSSTAAVLVNSWAKNQDVVSFWFDDNHSLFGKVTGLVGGLVRVEQQGTNLVSYVVLAHVRHFDVNLNASSEKLPGSSPATDTEAKQP